jgi:hypothetical protein
VTLPHGVRCIFALDGKAIEAVDELLHGSSYVCSRSEPGADVVIVKNSFVKIIGEKF